MAKQGLKELIANIEPWYDIARVFPGGVQDFKFALGEGDAWFIGIPELKDTVKKEVRVERVDLSDCREAASGVERGFGLLNSDEFQLSGIIDISAMPPKEDEFLYRFLSTRLYEHKLADYEYLQVSNLEPTLTQNPQDEKGKKEYLEILQKKVKNINALINLREVFIPEKRDVKGNDGVDILLGVIYYSGTPVRYSYAPKVVGEKEFTLEELARIFKRHLEKEELAKDFPKGDHTGRMIRKNLEREGITNYRQVICTPQEDIKGIKSVGEGSYRLLKERLFSKGHLNLGMFPKDY